MTRTLVIAILALTWMPADCSAAPPEGSRGKGTVEAGQRRGPAQRGEAGQRGETRQRGEAGQRRNAGQDGQQRFGDPAQMIARMMQEFDKDGDQKLDTQELTALLTSMRERRGGGMVAGAAGARGGRPGQAGEGAGNAMRQRSGREGMRRPGGDDQSRPGGERPKRPTAE